MARREQCPSTNSTHESNMSNANLQLLGLVQSLKGITSDSISSQCVLKSYSDGKIEMVNKTDLAQLSQFNVIFITSNDEDQGCNYATFLPLEESAPLQVRHNVMY